MPPWTLSTTTTIWQQHLRLLPLLLLFLYSTKRSAAGSIMTTQPRHRIISRQQHGFLATCRRSGGWWSTTTLLGGGDIRKRSRRSRTAVLSSGSGWEGYESKSPRAVYVHMPFCRRRCYYCDFPIKVVGDRPGTAESESEAYVQLLLRELRASREQQGPIHASNVKAAGGLTSIFFGGGTPSLTPPHLIDVVVKELSRTYGVAEGGMEVSMEMDPGTFDAAKLRAFLDCGVNRVSMGVQSFEEALLRACGRAHSLDDVYRAVSVLRGEGVDNYSIDLISGLPGQTMSQWEHSLWEAVAARPAHVSIYDLQVETGTAFGRWYGRRSTTTTTTTKPLPGEDLSAAMYCRASQVMQSHGYTHYEVSNYARPGFECRHNRVYWEGLPYLALGMGASSFTLGHRFTRPRSLSEYSTWVGHLEDKGYAQATGYEGARALTSKQEWQLDRLEDGLMVGLRLREGVDVGSLATATAGGGGGGQQEAMTSIVEACRRASQPFVDAGVVVWYDDDGDDDDNENSRLEGGGVGKGGGGRRRMRLSDPEGFLLSSTIIAELYAEIAGLPYFTNTNTTGGGDGDEEGRYE